jgi:hypothetical protein
VAQGADLDLIDTRLWEAYTVMVFIAIQPKKPTPKDTRMTLDEVKAATKQLQPQERRQLALYILELEKDHFQDKVGPQIAEDIDGLAKSMQDAIEKVRNSIKRNL